MLTLPFLLKLPWLNSEAVRIESKEKKARQSSAIANLEVKQKMSDINVNSPYFTHQKSIVFLVWLISFHLIWVHIKEEKR